jgi:uncharacterized protein YodC (DUF2158 family)
MGAKFKAGEKVQGKDGSAVMTIQSVNVHAKAKTHNPKPAQTVRCTWFDGTKMQSATFHQKTLKIAKEATPAAKAATLAIIKKPPTSPKKLSLPTRAKPRVLRHAPGRGTQ